jgi:flagellar hook assembly protein FlgD
MIALNQNTPNPVVDRTTICYVLPWRTETQLRIYDVTGKVVKTLVNGIQESGVKKVDWNRTDDHGKAVHSGVYFYRLSTETGDSFTKIMTVF